VIHRFGGLELDEALFELRRDGEVVPLQRRQFDLLLYLVKNREVVVEKAALLRDVWSDVVVAKDALPRAMMAVRVALGDDVDEARFIHTVRGRGYRFIARVESVATRGGDAPVSSAAPLVGRASTLARLRARAEEAIRGRGGFALIAGDAGVGKTRLVEELCRGLRARVISVRCYPSDGVPELWPFAQALRELPAWGIALDADLRAVSQGTLPRSELDAPERRFRIFDDLARAFAATTASSELPASKCEALLLCIDDLEAADLRSLEFLAFLAPRLTATSVLVVLAYRATSLRHPFRAILGDLASEPATCAVALEPLTRTEVADYLAHVLSSAPAPSIVDKVYRKTKGSPLLVTQLVHVLQAEERLRATEISTSALIGSESMGEAIVHHVSSLPEPSVRALVMASVFGTTFHVTLLAAALDTSNAAVLRDLDPALAVRVIAPARSGAYEFTYPLVRDILYRRITPLDRALFHGRAGEALAAQLDSPVDHASAGDVARHFVAAAVAGDVDRATEWSLRAVELAEGCGDTSAAKTYAERGLDALRFAQRPDPSVRARLVAATRTGDR
jgi:predicted ATPase/DNA-binding winged helix-turn-helix (wHTH) protein